MGSLPVLLLVICWNSLKSIAIDLLNANIVKIQYCLKVFKKSFKESFFSLHSYSLGTLFRRRSLLWYKSLLKMCLTMFNLSQLNLLKKLASNKMRYSSENTWKLAPHLCMATSRRKISSFFGTKTILLHQRAIRKSSAWILTDDCM